MHGYKLARWWTQEAAEMRSSVTLSPTAEQERERAMPQNHGAQAAARESGSFSSVPLRRSSESSTASNESDRLERRRDAAHVAVRSFNVAKSEAREAVIGHARNNMYVNLSHAWL